MASNKHADNVELFQFLVYTHTQNDVTRRLLARFLSSLGEFFPDGGSGDNTWFSFFAYRFEMPLAGI